MNLWAAPVECIVTAFVLLALYAVWADWRDGRRARRRAQYVAGLREHRHVRVLGEREVRG